MSALALFAALLPAIAAAQAVDVTGYLAARGVNATGPASWLEGGFGRLEATGDRDDFVAVAQLGVDWRPSRYFDVHVGLTGRQDPEEVRGKPFGITEAYADGRLIFGLDELRLRAGHFFLPTSRENLDPLWASPYTINFSALNTWIAQEVRPVGADLEWRHVTRHGHGITSGATAFRGNDSMGALLAWRGWSVGNRLSTYGETLPLPPLGSLDTWFHAQRDDGTKPFGEDLDGRTGYSARIRYSIPHRGSVQYTFLDNRGDRELHRGEYAWDTVFHLAALEIGDPDVLVAAAEYMRGVTGMGHPPVFAEAGFHAAYLLVSTQRGRNRFTARLDLFGAQERDLSAAENNDESGRSWTLTWMHDLTPALRGAVEFTQVTGDRPAAQQYGFQPGTNGRTITLEARYRF